jgi:hypothetical protein
VRLVRRLLLAVTLALAAGVYVWVTAVRAAGEVRQRRASEREEWRHRAATGAQEAPGAAADGDGV